MRSRLLQHLRSNVVAYLALFVALGGTSAYAANTVFSTDIVDGEVKTPDLATGAVTGLKIADATVSWSDLTSTAVTTTRIKDGSVLGVDMTADTLTGTQIKESSLGTVPSASQASNADALQGLGASSFTRGNGKVYDFSTTTDLDGSTTLIDVPGLITMYGFCPSTTTGSGSYSFATGANEGFNVWTDNGNGNPTVLFVGSNTSAGSSFWNWDPTGDFLTFHLEGSAHRMTIWSFTQVRHSNLLHTDWCSFSGQALLTPGP
jgi:hypothetical protein